MRGDERAELWFELVPPNTELRQGDLFLDVELDPDEPPFDVLLLSQSCDLQRRKNHPPPETALFAACYRLSEFLGEHPDYFSNTSDIAGLDGVRRGFQPSLFIIPPMPSSTDVRMHTSRVIAFDTLQPQEFSEVEEWVQAGKRATALRAPYREYLAQALARYFMRVGLPLDVAPIRFRDAPAVETERIQAGGPLWQGGPLLTKSVAISVSPSENREKIDGGDDEFAGDSFFVARLEERRKTAVGCGNDPEQAKQSLRGHLARQYTALETGSHPNAQEWQWLSGLFS